MTIAYTQTIRNDGFGAQLQSLIWSILYCKLNDIKFVYTPFQEMAHNYDNDADFIYKKEQFIGFTKEYEKSQYTGELKYDRTTQFVNCVELDPSVVYKFIESSTNCSELYVHLASIRDLFFQDKCSPFVNTSECVDTDLFNIVVHIRRPNSHDQDMNHSIIYYNFNDHYILSLIDAVVKKYTAESSHIKDNVRVHIVSQGPSEQFEIYKSMGYILRLNESIEDTFLLMTFADALITAKSSFSYIAAYLNKNDVYYTKFWHNPLRHWYKILN